MCVCVCVCVCVPSLSLSVFIVNIVGVLFLFFVFVFLMTCVNAFAECREARDFVSQEVCSHARGACWQNCVFLELPVSDVCPPFLVISCCVMCAFSCD